MLHQLVTADRARRISRQTAVSLAVLVFAVFVAQYAAAQTVATYGFEDGTAGGWSSFNGASTPTATNAAAYVGSYSLLTSTSASGSGGPAINVGNVLQAGAQYTITGYVKLTSGEIAGNANFTIRRSDPTCSGGACYDTIGAYQVGVTASGWAQIGGSYTASATETGLTLYAQLIGATSAQGFYLDQVVITQTAPPPGGTPVASYTFKDGGLDGWSALGSAVLTNVASPLPDPNGNLRSLEVTNRNASYAGPGLNLLSINGVNAGATYQVTAYVLLAAPDSSNPTASVSIQSADCADPSGATSSVASSGPLSSNAWTKVQGTFSYSNQPGPPSQLGLYLQTSSPSGSFYVSGVTISQVAPAPLDPSQQDNSGLSATFEDGGVDGWASRTGNSMVANSTDAAHGGTHSLLTTGRTANYDGPQISVSNKMYPGSLYNVSVWVKIAASDNSQHVINMSLQTTYQGNTTYSSVTAYPGVTVAADGQWHQINVMNYSMAAQYDQGAASLYLQTVPANGGTDLASFYIDDFQLSYVAPPMIQQGIPSIYHTLANYFPIGAAVDPSDLTGPHAQLLMKHFNSITPGNELKWSSVEPSLGAYNYTSGDALVGMAVCNASRVRGQNLVWATGAQTPAYAFGDGTNSAANQALVTSNIQEHIKSEVQHYANKVYAWDVINEPIDASQPDCLERGPFYKVLGEKYIDVAFKAARKYAPAGTLLFLNEYSTADPDRLACLVKVIDGMKSRGVPIDGLGHESHESINYPSIAAVENSIETIHQNFPNLKQQITEFDLSVYNGGDLKANYGDKVPPAVLAEQGWLYKQYFDLFRKEKGKISAVTIWGMADDDTWLDSFPVTRTDYPLPFDMNLQAKPAYWGIVDPTKLPGYGLKLTVDSKVRDKGGNGATFTVEAQNGDAGTAYTTQISGITVTQVEGQTCATRIVANSLPIVLGTIPAGQSATASFDLLTAGCSGPVRFALSVPWSSATYNTGTLVKLIGFNVSGKTR